MTSGWRARESNEPDSTFNHLIKERKKSPGEIEIFTDSKSKIEECGNLVGCAIFIPYINKFFSFKLNLLTSSFMAETFAIETNLRNN